MGRFKESQVACMAAERVRRFVGPELGGAVTVHPVDAARVEVRMRLTEDAARALLRRVDTFGLVRSTTARDSDA